MTSNIFKEINIYLQKFKQNLFSPKINLCRLLILRLLFRGGKNSTTSIFYIFFQFRKEKVCEPDVTSPITTAFLGCMYKAGIGLLQYQELYLTYSITVIIVYTVVLQLSLRHAMVLHYHA